MAAARKTAGKKAAALTRATRKKTMKRVANDNLSTYRAKRDFARTKEPQGGATEGGALSFVVQHHWATRDHYDFRLELDGVLKSWAVTRGPSTDTNDKRLAVRVEDHPLDYGGFEGTIPKGQYGGGTVMIWDRGTWEPLADDPDAALDEGKLAFVLHGERMKGRWALVRMKSRRPGDEKRENWLLIKEKDEFAKPLGHFLDRATTSVASGRTRAQIETGDTAVWQSTPRAAAREGAKPRRRGTAPEFTPPMLASAEKSAPEGDDWRYEIKYDGYRLQACINGGNVTLFTREGLDWTRRFSAIATALADLDLPACAIDGEAVVFDARGLSDFSKLVASLDSDHRGIDFVAFDLLSLKQRDLRDKPLSARRKELEKLLAEADDKTIRLAAVLKGDGKAVFERVIDGGAEGIVAKRQSSTYQSRRSRDWAKIKGERRTDVIVVGYMPSPRRPFASLAAAMEDADGLRFVGGVGTGFSATELDRTKARLDSLARKQPAPMREIDKALRKIVWVTPKLQAEIQFAGFTGDGQLRHARFLGWKEDRKGAAPAPAKAKAAEARATSATAVSGPVRLTHPDRVLIPQAKLTKQHLADYYAAVADRIMPHLKGRPVSLVRAPDGIEKETFFQRHVLAGMKIGIGKVPDPGRGHGDYLEILSPDGLATAAQFSVLELHGWGAKLPKLDHPDRVVFDLDPDESVAFADVRRAANEIRDLLNEIGLKTFPLLSGGKGVHVIAPLDATQDWDMIAGFAEGIAKGMAKAAPDKFVAVAAKDRRKGRIYIDWLRNRQSASAIVPWSPRARASGSAAVPVSWDELKRVKSADQFSWAAAAKRSDPWDGFFKTKQKIAKGVLEHLRKQF